MKESHFELPRSQYMESQSNKSRLSKGGQIMGSDNGETNAESGVAALFPSPKKIVSWEMVLQECEATPATPTLNYH